MARKSSGKHHWVLLVVLPVLVIAGGLGYWAMYGKKTTSDTDATRDTANQVSSQNTGREKKAEVLGIKNEMPPQESRGTLRLVNGIFSIADDPAFEDGLYVRNSANSKLAAVLELFVGKRITFTGIVKEESPNQMVVLFVEGKQVLAESEAMSMEPLAAEVEGESFAEFYATLSRSQQSCVQSALGGSAVKRFLDDPKRKASDAELNKIAACLQ